MHENNLKLHFRPTSTGIMVEARDQSGQCVAYREVSAALMRHYVSRHADRAAAVAFDAAIEDAIRRDENANGNISASVFDQCAIIAEIDLGIVA